uniref:Nucleotidyltransferase domain-containing protein n=1 Tax=Gracilinema caldarium TaxID=215591 RepID=A0A7C3I2B0_9SPIR
MRLDLDQQVIDKIKAVLKKENNIQKIIVFGSRAKHTAKPGSDIDIAILGEDLTFQQLCRIGAELDELDLPYKIDLIDYNAITNQELKNHIDRVGIAL